MTKINSSQEIGIGIVFNKIGQLLIDKRLEKSTMGGMWEFPGGKKNSYETIEETIVRELKEEVGIIVKVGIKLLSFEHAYTHKSLHFTVYICQWITGDPKPLSSQKLLWVYPDELIKYSFPAANSKIIAELKKYLRIKNKNL